MSAPTKADKAAADRVLNAASKSAIRHIQEGRMPAAESILDAAQVIADLLLGRENT